MIKTLMQINRMKTMLGINTFFYYFKRLWFVGKRMPDTVYSQYELKKVFAVISFVIRQFLSICEKLIFLLSFVGLPIILMFDSRSMGMAFSAMVQILFFLNCIIGSFGDSRIFSVTREKAVCIKYMHMDVRKYIRAALIYTYVPFFLYYLPWLLIASKLLGKTLLHGFSLWFMLWSFRMMGEAFHLLIFDRTGKVISRNMIYEWLLIGAGLAGAYLPVALGWDWKLSEILLHPVTAAVYITLGAASLWYITVGYRGYEKKFHHSIDLDFLMSKILKNSLNISTAIKEVELKDSDTDVSAADNFRHLKGYAYINALFFTRHRRQLIRPVCYRLISAGGLFLAAVFYWIFNREYAVSLSGNLSAMLPFFVYIMYFMTVADKAARAMFYNCDKDMLRYAYYRQPKTILSNFRIRLLRVSLYDLVIAGSVCLAAVLFRLLCGASIFTLDLLLFCTTILLLSVLFTAHHLCLYYIFQPYSESLHVKNPFYSLINVGMYVLCFMCLQIKTGGLVFTLAALAFTVIYIAGALALVYYRAPKSFRVK